MKLKHLKWWDILTITLIMIGPAIWSSTKIFLQSPSQPQDTVFTTQQNIYAIVSQSIQLAAAFAYLHLRKFDFSQWRYKITCKHTLFGIGMFCLLGFMIDLLSVATDGWEWVPALLAHNTPLLSALSEVTLSVVLFSILNGFYEEIFFLGICTSVREEHQKYAFVYALVIRFSFHLYQGISSAAGIGLFLGILYYVLYQKKTKNLYPYMLSHTFADIFGLSFLHFL